MSARTIRIRSRGPAFQIMVMAVVFGVGCGLLVDVVPNGEGMLTALAAGLALVAFVAALGWMSTPRVLIDRDNRKIWFGSDCVSFDVFATVYRSRILSYNREIMKQTTSAHQIWLARNDDVPDKLVALRSTEFGARRLERIVGEALQLPTLGERS